MDYKPLNTPLDQYIILPPDRIKELQLDHYRRNQAWFLQQLDDLGADWLMVGGISGKIHMKGSMEDFPRTETIEQMARTTGEVPFTWTRPPIIIEEICLN